jgi:hypothetical protein
MIPFGKNLNIKSRTKNPTDKDSFIEIIGVLNDCWVRSEILETQFGLPISNYEEPFYLIAEELIYMHYGEWKGDIISWWLFERLDENGVLLPFNVNNNDEQTEEKIFIKTVEELWGFIKKLEKK